MRNLSLFLLGFGPSLVWLYWLWSRDRFQREPLGMVIRLMLGGGILSVALTLLTAPLVAATAPTAEDSVLVHMLLTAALPEESFKLLTVLLLAWRSVQWNEPFDGIVYAGAAALGFHLSETLVYMVRSLDAGLGSALFQALIRGAKPGHMLYGVVMGYFLSQARFGRRWGPRLQSFALSLVVPVGLHTAWNVSSAYGGSFVGVASLRELLFSLAAWGLSVALWITAFAYIRKDRLASPFRDQAQFLRAAAAPCSGCGAAYPASARHCTACGRPVQVGESSVQEL